jgi:arylsulfatase A-like enzyme
MQSDSSMMHISSSLFARVAAAVSVFGKARFSEIAPCTQSILFGLRRDSKTIAVLMLLGFVVSMIDSVSVHAEESHRPNIVLIVTDDLGYGDLGCYGQQIIRTPRLDALAAQGLRFTDFYAGCTVCAPSRSVLMTGQHGGHTHVRGNAGARMEVQSLRDDDVTIAECLRPAGYRNALIGKWGLGEVDQPGFPLKQGFDRFYGYLNQTHAHNYYPEFLWDDDRKVQLANVVTPAAKIKAGGFIGGAATKRIDYSPDLFVKQAEAFIRESQAKPFFLYLALTAPHANNEGTRMTGNGAEVPDYGSYADEAWPDADKGQAAMITRMDSDVGRIVDLLGTLKLAENTLVFFTSDNGPHDEAGHDLTRFNPAGQFSGIKRSLTEGGIRVPAIAYWPSKIKAGSISNHVAYHGDLMATCAELAGVPTPSDCDSISFVPTLMSESAKQTQHEYLYWEFYEQGSRQAVRFGQWKAIREPMITGPIRLYDLEADPKEQSNLAAERVDLVSQATRFLDEAHRSHPNWPLPSNPKKAR